MNIMARTDGARRFRPTFWPTVMAIPMLAVLLGLGSWQVQRLHWKEGLIAEREAGLAAPPLDIGEVGAAVPEFRRVRASGVFLHDREFLLVARTYRGRAGSHVVTPLRLADGGIVLVDRGWVPYGYEDPRKRPAGQIAGRVVVSGILRAGGRDSPWIHDNDAVKGDWFYVDIAAMAAHARLSGARGFFIEAGSAANPGGLPVGGQTRFQLANDHLQYAVIWYALAAVLLAIYLVYHLRRGDDD